MADAFSSETLENLLRRHILASEFYFRPWSVFDFICHQSFHYRLKKFEALCAFVFF